MAKPSLKTEIKKAIASQKGLIQEFLYVHHAMMYRDSLKIFKRTYGEIYKKLKEASVGQKTFSSVFQDRLVEDSLEQTRTVCLRWRNKVGDLDQGLSFEECDKYITAARLAVEYNTQIEVTLELGEAGLKEATELQTHFYGAGDVRPKKEQQELAFDWVRKSAPDLFCGPGWDEYLSSISKVYPNPVVAVEQAKEDWKERLNVESRIDDGNYESLEILIKVYLNALNAVDPDWRTLKAGQSQPSSGVWRALATRCSDPGLVTGPIVHWAVLWLYLGPLTHAHIEGVSAENAWEADRPWREEQRGW